MTNRHQGEDPDIAMPRDHLPPAEDREDDETDPEYPGADAPGATSAVSPETAAEPDKPRRHGVDRLPPSGR